MPRFSPRVRRFGLWLLFAPRGGQSHRYFRDVGGNWLLTTFQRRLGIRYLPTTVYKRSFARMGNWKGGFFTHAKCGAPRTLQRLTPLAEAPPISRSYTRFLPHEKRSLHTSTGYAYLWAPRIRLLRSLPFARLVAVVPEMVRHWHDGI
jgi:hypothetical protein